MASKRRKTFETHILKQKILMLMSILSKFVKKDDCIRKLKNGIKKREPAVNPKGL